MSRPSTSHARDAQLVHHDSPFGPATSVYPKGYLGQRLQRLQSGTTSSNSSNSSSNSSSVEESPTHSTPRLRREVVVTPPPPPPAPPLVARAPIPTTMRLHPPSPQMTDRLLLMDRRERSQAETAKLTACQQPQRGERRQRRRRSSIEQQQFSSPRHNQQQIEASPGFWLRLRGSAETKECIRNDFFLPTLCSGCREEIFGIQDAAYLLCPHCRIIGPLWGSNATEEEGGVGLGFTLQDIESVQFEMISNDNGDR